MISVKLGEKGRYEGQTLIFVLGRSQIATIFGAFAATQQDRSRGVELNAMHVDAHDWPVMKALTRAAERPVHARI
jgi:hypothetical protein